MVMVGFNNEKKNNVFVLQILVMVIKILFNSYNLRVLGMKNLNEFKNLSLRFVLQVEVMVDKSLKLFIDKWMEESKVRLQKCLYYCFV